MSELEVKTSYLEPLTQQVTSEIELISDMAEVKTNNSSDQQVIDNKEVQQERKIVCKSLFEFFEQWSCLIFAIVFIVNVILALLDVDSFSMINAVVLAISIFSIYPDMIMTYKLLAYILRNHAIQSFCWFWFYFIVIKIGLICCLLFFELNNPNTPTFLALIYNDIFCVSYGLSLLIYD